MDIERIVTNASGGLPRVVSAHRTVRDRERAARSIVKATSPPLCAISAHGGVREGGGAIIVEAAAGRGAIGVSTIATDTTDCVSPAQGAVGQGERSLVQNATAVARSDGDQTVLNRNSRDVNSGARLNLEYPARRIAINDRARLSRTCDAHII